MQISEKDTDAFERVEGRFVERFLEGLPLTLGYIEVAYTKTEYKGCLPEMNQLLAFRVNDTFLHVMSGDIIEPNIKVQPNFEVHVESELYPVRILAQLTKIADVVAKDRTNILKLRKKKVLTQLSEREDFDVIKLLENMSTKKLPQNVKIELDEWIGASEAFTLYEKVVLFEGDKYQVLMVRVRRKRNDWGAFFGLKNIPLISTHWCRKVLLNRLSGPIVSSFWWSRGIGIRSGIFEISGMIKVRQILRKGLYIYGLSSVSRSQFLHVYFVSMDAMTDERITDPIIDA